MANCFRGVTLRWNNLFFQLIFSLFTEVMARPLPIKQQNTDIIDKLGQWSVIRFCHQHHLDEQLLQSPERNHKIFSDANLSAMNLLYEFASGTGPVGTYWKEYHPYTQAIRDGTGIKEVCKWYTEMQTSSVYKPALDIRYQASATVIPFRPHTWYFAFEQNIRLLRENNYSQFILGSFNVKIDTLGNDLFLFSIKNRMSRKSLFIGLGPRVQRPLPLGTTFQHISFTLNKEEILNRANAAGKKKGHQ